MGSTEKRKIIVHHFGDRHTDYDERDLPCPEKLQKPWAFSFEVVKDEYGEQKQNEVGDMVFGWNNKALEQFDTNTFKLLNELLEKEKDGEGKFLGGPPFIEDFDIELKCS